MSHRNDRERARNGLLFRNGRLISKEELQKEDPGEASPDEAVAMIDTAMRVAGVPKSQ